MPIRGFIRSGFGRRRDPINGRNRFHEGIDIVAAKGTLRGVVTGLRVGRNLFVADGNGRGEGRPFATLTITNHPRGRPVLLGSQAQPWICATPTPVAASGNTPASNASGLSTFAVDAQCNIATEYKLFYRTTTSPCSTALPDPNPPAGTHPIFQGFEHVWRSWAFGAGHVSVPQQTTPDIAGYEANCPEFVTAGNSPACGDYQPLGGPAGLNQPGDLTGSVYGADRAGGSISWMARDGADHGTLWAATSAGRKLATRIFRRMSRAIRSSIS